jgi:hypothetical protein
MSLSLSKQHATVRRLADDAELAAGRELAFRTGIVERGRRIVTGSKLVIVTGLAGFLLLAMRPSRRHRDEHDGARHREREEAQDESRGLLARAGMFLLAAYRWRGLTTDVLQLVRPPPPVQVPESGAAAKDA